VTGEIITTSTLAVGVAGYLGSEFLKPTLEAMGGSFRDLITARVSKVFVRAAEKLTPIEMGPPIPPGFLALFIQRSSFADDSENITELWANLLADAARAFSNKHVNYVDILSQLGPAEVGFLDQLVGQNAGSGYLRPGNLHPSVGLLLGKEIGDIPQTAEQASAALTRVLSSQTSWPGGVLGAEMPYFHMGQATYINGIGSGGSDRITMDLLALLWQDEGTGWNRG